MLESSSYLLSSFSFWLMICVASLDPCYALNTFLHHRRTICKLQAQNNQMTWRWLQNPLLGFSTIWIWFFVGNLEPLFETKQWRQKTCLVKTEKDTFLDAVRLFQMARRAIWNNLRWILQKSKVITKEVKSHHERSQKSKGQVKYQHPKAKSISRARSQGIWVSELIMISPLGIFRNPS